MAQAERSAKAARVPDDDEVPFAEGDEATKEPEHVDVARLYLSPAFKVHGRPWGPGPGCLAGGAAPAGQRGCCPGAACGRPCRHTAAVSPLDPNSPPHLTSPTSPPRPARR
jgi:hypothetical protein